MSADALLSVLAETLARGVSEAERTRARLHLLDWLACVAGGRDTEAGHLGGLISRQGWERATYVGNALGLEDVHEVASLSPGPVVWPAAMSIGSANMNARLDAGVRGYEAMIAIGAALDEHHHAHWDASATAGVFGSAAACGSLIGFAEVEYRNALGNAGSVAGGLQHLGVGHVLTRQWQTYHAVRTGRDAALHVHYGATGPVSVLEGPGGLFAAMTMKPAKPASAGEAWLISSACCKPVTGNATGEPAQQVTQDQIIEKMRLLGNKGGLSEGDAQRATDCALNGDDPAAIDSMLEDWLA